MSSAYNLLLPAFLVFTSSAFGGEVYLCDFWSQESLFGLPAGFVIFMFLIARMIRGDDKTTSSNIPPHVVMKSDGRLEPERGWVWMTGHEGDFRVRPENTILIDPKKGTFEPAPGYQWLSNKQDDCTVVRQGAPTRAETSRRPAPTPQPAYQPCPTCGRKISPVFLHEGLNTCPWCQEQFNVEYSE